MSGNNQKNFKHVPSVPQPLKTGQGVKLISTFILSLVLWPIARIISPDTTGNTAALKRWYKEIAH